MDHRPRRGKQRISAAEKRTVARPLDMLVFLLPLIAFYEIAYFTRSDRVIAFDLLRNFFEMFGRVGIWAPGAAVAAILLATHIASRQPWVINWRTVGWMYIEAPLAAIPLLAMNWFAPLSAGGNGDHARVMDQLAQGVGAGIYEELVFRLILISLLLIVGADVLRVPRRLTVVLAVVIASLVFAAYHHQPFGHETFDLMRFAFRTVAGMYLAVVFWYRGYAPAAGCHAAYNAVLVVVSHTQF